MTKSLRQKGAIEWVPLSKVSEVEALEGVDVGIEHLGPGRVRQWKLRVSELQLKEKRRLMALKKEFTAEDMPELYRSGEFVTSDAQAESLEASAAILRECCAVVRGLPVLNGIGDRAVIVEELVRLGLVEALIGPALLVQELSAEQIFTEDSGDVE